MNLEELRAANAAEETAGQEEVAEVEEVEQASVADVGEILDEEEADESGDEATPLWMQEEEADDQTSAETVPLSALMKQKHKGKEKDAEIEELRKKVAALEQSPPRQSAAEKPKMPRADDFDTDEEHETAMEKYLDDVVEYRTSVTTSSASAKQQEAARIQARDAAIDGFIERADKVVTKHNISPEVYKGALDSVQVIVEGAFPNLGVNAFPEFLAKLKPGAETALFQIGRNEGQKKILSELFKNDPTGIDAFWHIATLTANNAGAKNKPSQASKPAATVRGNVAVTAKEGAYLKKYKAAKSPQAAYDAKKAGKAAGFDTSKWS
jgi:hypothetical protein